MRIATLSDGLSQLQFDCEKGVYSLRRASDGRIFVWRSALRVGEWDSRRGYRFTVTREQQPEGGPSLRIVGRRVGAPDLVVVFTLRPFLLICAGIINTTTQPIRLRELHPVWARAAQGGGLFVGPDPEKDHRALTGEGDFVCPALSRRIDAESANLLSVTWLDEPDVETLVLGGLSTFDFQHRAAVEYTRATCLKKDGRKSIDGWVRVFDRTGRRVDPDEEYLADPVYVDCLERDPYHSLEAYARRVAEAMNVRLANYNDYIPECLWYVWAYSGGGRMANTSTGAVAEAARMIDSGIARYAPPLIRLVPDEYTNPNEQLWWDEPHWQKFVHLTEPYETLAKWTAALREKGAYGDFYMQPTYRSDDYCEAFPGHMLGNDPKRGPDYTDPDFVAHMRQVYERLRAADVRGVFYDYSAQYMNVSGGFEDDKSTAVAAYRRIFSIAKEVMGPEFLITENPFTYGNGAEVATGVIDAKRSEDDKVTFTQSVVRRGVREWYRNRVTKLIDPDVKNFATRPGDLLQAQVTGMALMFGKLMLGSSVTRYPPEVVEIIGRSLPMPMTGRSARPVGLFAGCDEEGAPNPEVYHYACGGDDHILLFWNHSGESDNYIRAELGRPPAFGGVEVQSDLDYDVWDFWDWRYVGRVAGRNTLTLSVRPAEMKTLMLRPVRPHPYLLSTNRHVLQGEIDAHSVTWDEATRTLSGAFDVVARDRYRAVLKLPDSRWQVSEWTLEASDAVGRQLRHDRQAAWVELSIDSPENARLAWSVKFALAEAPSPAPAPAQASQGEPAPNLEPPSARLTSIQPGDGDWQGRCGRQGYLLPSYNGEGEDAVRLPTYISAVHWGENAAGWVFARATSDARALPLPDASGRRLGAVFARNTLDVYIETTDRAPHAVTLYCVDFDRRGRRQRLVVLDPGTLRPISPAATLEDFQEGVYAEVVISGSAIVRLTNLAPYDSARNAVLSGVFFDSPTPRPPQAFRLHEPQLAAERAYRLSWEPSPGAEFYRLLVFDGKGNSVVDEVLRETSYEVKGLSAGKSYRWSVEARNHDGVGAPLGEPASFVARFPAPARAEWLGADRDTGSNWQNVYGKAGYVLFAGGPDGPADVVHLPAFIASATATGERVNWRDGVLSGSYTCAFDQIMLHVTAKDRRAHRMTLAFASGQGCNSGIEIWDPHYETLLCRAWVAAPRGETRYVSFDVAGDVRVVLSRNRDCFPKNALLSAVYWE